MNKGIEQLKTYLKTILAPDAGLERMPPQEPYAAFLQAAAPMPAALEQQRQAPGHGLPSFTLVLAGSWDAPFAGCTLDSLAAQTYQGFSLCTHAEKPLGDYILYLWPGDTLAPDALYTFAQMAGQGADLIYCDEDIFAGDGMPPKSPFFKSAPSAITQMSYDMLSCGVAVSHALFQKAGPMAGMLPEHRYAYNLKCLQHSCYPIHIPRPLYTLRQARQPGPAARQLLLPLLEKAEAFSPGQWAGSFRLERLPDAKPRVSILIPHRDQLQPLRRLLESLERCTSYPYKQIVIADLGSHNGELLRYYSLLEKHRAAKIIYAQEPALPKALNLAARQCEGDVLVFLDGAAEALAPGWLDSLLGQLCRPGAGAVGGKLVDHKGHILSSSHALGLGGWSGSLYAGQPDNLGELRQNRLVNSIRQVSALPFSTLAVYMDRFWNMGGFDESLSWAGLALDLCLRLACHGYANIYTPYSLFRYHAALPTPAASSLQAQQRCYDILRPYLLWGDPHYSPNYDPADPVPRAATAPYPAIRLNGLYQSAMALL